MAVGLREDDEILQDHRNGNLQIIYLKENRLVGFQLAGNIRSAGILRTLMIHTGDIRPIKHRLLHPGFGQESMVWKYIAPYV